MVIASFFVKLYLKFISLRFEQLITRGENMVLLTLSSGVIE